MEIGTFEWHVDKLLQIFGSYLSSVLSIFRTASAVVGRLVDMKFEILNF